MHFWITVKNWFWFFIEICFRDLIVTHSYCTSSSLKMVVTWKKQECAWPEGRKSNKKNLHFFFLQLNNPTNQNWIQNSLKKKKLYKKELVNSKGWHHQRLSSLSQCYLKKLWRVWCQSRANAKICIRNVCISRASLCGEWQLIHLTSCVLLWGEI